MNFPCITVPANRTLILWSIPASVIYGLLSGARWPLPYTLSHLVINYHFGFGKRGLLGYILSWIDKPPYHSDTLAIMSITVFIVWMTTFVALIWQTIRADVSVSIAVTLFFLSAGFASLACDVGRGEHFGLLLALPCLLMPNGLIWIALRATLLLFAILIQEANFLIVVLLVAFDLRMSLANTAFNRVKPFIMILPAAMLTYYLGNLRTACDSGVAMAYFQHQAADFEFQAVPLATLCLAGRDNFHLVATAVWSYPERAIILPLALLVALPSTIFNLVLASQALRRQRRKGLALCALAIFAPLGLVVVGADLVRFVTLIQITSLLALLSLIRRGGLPVDGVVRDRSRLFKAAVAVVCMVQLSAVLTLQDGTQMGKFPFTSAIQQLFTSVH